jgi:lysine-N-methylase
VLNKRPDGACVFLNEDNRCRIHCDFGEEAKPVACRLFPFSVRPVREGWQASLRFDCPSVAESKGKPIEQHRSGLGELAKAVSRHGPDDTGVDLQRGVRASAEEIEIATRRFIRWMKSDNLTLTERLIRAARVTTTLSEAKLTKVRGPRLAELLDLLFGARGVEFAAVPAAPTSRQRGMLRQLVFAHAEHVSLAELRSGWVDHLRKRWQQLRIAKALLREQGDAPRLLDVTATTSLATIDAVKPSSDRTTDIEDLMRRYVSARLESRSVFGNGYYGWPVVSGLTALWLSVAVAGWLARYTAAADGGASLSWEDAARALGMVDRAATRLPVLGTFSERARISYLLRDDGVARLVRSYSLCGEES